MSKELHDKILSLPCPATQSQFATRHELNCFKDGHQAAREASAALALAAAAPQVVADERAALSIQSAFEKAAGGCIFGDASRLEAAQDWFKQGYLAAAPVQAQEPVACKTCGGAGIVRDGEIDHYPDGTPYMHGPVECVKECPDCAKPVAPVQPVAVPDGSIVLSGHQLRMALDLINPGGPDERDELEDELMFGIRQHRDDDGKVSTDMCCWNGDTDGVLPMNGEYESPTAPAAQGDAKELTDDEIVQAVHSVGVDTHPSKFGFAAEQIEGMSVPVLRCILAAMLRRL